MPLYVPCSNPEFNQDTLDHVSTYVRILSYGRAKQFDIELLNTNQGLYTTKHAPKQSSRDSYEYFD